jgi:succinate dehydrogenase / fumarate reductase, cytochrome b subunit
MNMPARPRPLSPHLGIYRWQIGNTLSILHRLTGVALAAGFAALCFWLISLSAGEGSYRAAARAFASPIGLVFLAGWTFSFLYHLLNGIRHLFWDMGKGFGRVERRASGWFAVIGSLVLTLGVWLLLWRGGRL